MRELESLKKMSPDGKVLPFNQALVYLGIGDHARALDNLEKAYAANSQLLAWLGQDAMFDSLRSEPRFVELLRRDGGYRAFYDRLQLIDVALPVVIHKQS